MNSSAELAAILLALNLEQSRVEPPPPRLAKEPVHPSPLTKKERQKLLARKLRKR